MQGEMMGSGAAQTRRRATIQRTRRFAFLGAAITGVALLVATTVTFTAENGTVSGLTITGGTGAVVVTSTTSSATASTTTTPNTAPEKWAFAASTTATAPSWSPTVGQPTSITANGDLILIDTRGKTTSDKVTVTVALQNAASLTYSTFILPVAMREASGTIGTSTSWTTVPTGGATQYLTLTSPVVTFSVTGGKLYEVIVPGSTSNGLVVANATTTLAPSFLVQAN